MSKKARLRLEKDTCMAVDAAETCIKRHKAGKAFSLEHPGRSIALELPAWKRLRNMDGVFSSFYHTCMFPGSSRRKHQILIHNRDSSGKWRPIVSAGRVTQYITGEEREYPRGFCMAYAESVRQSILERSLKSFVEVFCGPNAPLSAAVAGVAACPPPGDRVSDRGQREFQSLKELETAPKERVPTSKSSPPTGRVNPTQEMNREYAVNSGRQPSFGKRKQMIEDGVNDPVKHLEMARTLKHPFERMEGLKQIHKQCIDKENSISDVRAERDKILSSLRDAASSPEVKKRTKELRSRGGTSSKKLGERLNLGLMEWVQNQCQVEDKAIPLLCAVGMPILGPALESPFFLKFEEPQKVTRGEFNSTTKSRRKEAVRKTEYMAKLGGDEMARAIWAKAQQEVKSGTMGAPLTEHDASRRYGEHYNLIPSFGLRQGVGSDGKPKFRRIDDHTAGWVNLAAKRLQKIPMASADYISTMIRAPAEAYPDSELELATADMKAAYRQVPLAEEDIRVALTCIYNPDTAGWTYTKCSGNLSVRGTLSRIFIDSLNGSRESYVDYTVFPVTISSTTFGLYQGRVWRVMLWTAS